MKTTKLVVVALVLLSSFPILSRHSGAQTQKSLSSVAAVARMSHQAHIGANGNRHLVIRVQASLERVEATRAKTPGRAMPPRQGADSIR